MAMHIINIIRLSVAAYVRKYKTNARITKIMNHHDFLISATLHRLSLVR